MRYMNYATYRPRTNVNKTNSAPAVTYTADTIWGAAAYANRINSGYYKDGHWDVDISTGQHTRVKEPNRDLVKSALNNQSLITDADREHGQVARKFLAQQLVIRSLKGTLSNFDASISSAINMDSFTDRDRLQIAQISSQIQAYERALTEQAFADRIDTSKGHLADIGAKVTANVEISKVVYSQNYGTFFVSGITDTNQAVFFSYREKLAVGSKIQVKGTVKAHRPDSTQLNRVKVVA